MKKAKIGMMFLISVVALAMVGGSYAQWFDNVDINATTTNGDLEYRITKFDVTKQDGLDQNNNGINEWEPSWTGCHAYANKESITVTVDPTYPGWNAFVCIKVKNTGNIPIKMHGLQIQRISGKADLMNYYLFGIPDGDTCNNIGYNDAVYHRHSFNWWTNEKYYSDLLPAANIPVLEPDESAVLGGYFELSENVPQWENKQLTVKVTLSATQAVDGMEINP